MKRILILLFLFSSFLSVAQIPVNVGVVSSQSSVNFTEEYQEVLDRATALGYTLPSPGQRVKQNQLVITLKALGVWNTLDVFYAFETDGDSDFATLNWKDPDSHQASKVNSPTFTPNHGFTGNGTTSYLNTDWNPSIHGVNYTLNSAGIGCYSSTGVELSANFLFGASDGTGITNLNPRTPTNTCGFRINQSASLNFSNSNASGFWHLQRTASNAISIHKDGSSLSTGTTTSNQRPNQPIFLLALNNNTTPSNFAARNIGMFWAGANMNGLESAFYTAWNTYHTSL